MDARQVLDQAMASAGFDAWGVAPVETPAELENLSEWLARGYAGEMDYLADPRRSDPRKVMLSARSLIVGALNYNTERPYSTQVPPDPERGWISRYAWGDDYHTALKEKLGAVIRTMWANIGEPFEARAYVDTGPVVERVAARYASLGWLAKNTCLINENLGSWLFLGIILTSLDLLPAGGSLEAPPPDLCGNCRLCIEACPTGAIVEPYVLDARRCISYLTIELRGSIPEEFRASMGRHVFGCDICQDVCPWNRKSPVTQLAAFLPRENAIQDETQKSIPKPRDENRLQGVPHPFEERVGTGGEPAASSRSEDITLLTPSLEWLASMSEEEFRRVFRGSAIKRTKWQGLVRNACVALGNSGVKPGTPAYARIIALLERLAASENTVIAEHARWALERLGRAFR